MERVLLLNQTFEFIAEISWKEAVDLILRERVEAVVQEAVKIVKTVRGEFHVPSVLRLIEKVSIPFRRKRWSRNEVFKRDDWTCIFCGVTVGDHKEVHNRLFVVRESDFTIDHLIPVSQGGKSTFNNTACACLWCNHKKADRTPREANMPLKWKPRRPKQGEFPERWRKVLGY